MRTETAQQNDGQVGMFRDLNPEEEVEFRIYAHDHPTEAGERLAAGTIEVIHPVVRDEWRRMGLLPGATAPR